ncbi:Dynactin subunit 6 [Chamberlinius hualienensis]
MSSSSSKTSVKIAPRAVVCSECEVIGDVTIGSNTVIHPKARIVAESGPIIIGEGNLIEEQVNIINSNESKHVKSQPMIIGNYNVFEVGTYCEALQVGDNNVLEAKCKVGRDTKITNGCVIGAMCEVTTPETIPENMVIYGRQCERRLQSEKPTAQNLQLDFLAKVLPNYHNIMKNKA